MLKLEKSNEEIKQFAYVTSHDLKSPLRNISSLLQLAKKKNEHIITEDSKELIDICIKSANSLYNIVNDVLLYTTSEVDIASFSKIDVNEVVYDVLNNINSFVDENNARVNVKNKLPFVFSHKTMIFNLFLNLIQNGIKYNKSEVPQVDIDFVEDDFNFIFSISDNGIGIDEKYKEQIFVVFKRLHTQQKYEGTGIGLSICKKIVENLNGKIWIDSTVGEGSTFFISLPKD
jgi:light-regulated signal transduction histidine kinase (bacteriophytochrome)